MSADGEDHEKRDEEPRASTTARLDVPGACCICGRPERRDACMHCGRPVCYNEENDRADSTCGAWVQDPWQPSHPEEDEFYCTMCLHAAMIEGPVMVGRLTFAYTDHQTLAITVDGGQVRELNTEETRKLVAFLYDHRGTLFVDASKG